MYPKVLFVNIYFLICIYPVYHECLPPRIFSLHYYNLFLVFFVFGLDLEDIWGNVSIIRCIYQCDIILLPRSYSFNKCIVIFVIVPPFYIYFTRLVFYVFVILILLLNKTNKFLLWKVIHFIS